MSEPVRAWLYDAGLLLGLVLAVGCLLYGLLLALLPGLSARVAATLNRAFSSRQALRPLEIPRASEPFFYRHHRVFGGLLLSGVVTFFFLYFVDFPRESAAAQLADRLSRPFAEALIDGLVGFLLLANALIGLLAVVVIWRPSVLKPLEQHANRWISTRRALRSAEAPREPVDAWAARHPRVAGVLIAVGSSYLVASVLLAMAQ